MSCLSVAHADIEGLVVEYSTGELSHTNVISREARLGCWFNYELQIQINAVKKMSH